MNNNIIMVLMEDEMNADSFFIRKKSLLQVLAKMFTHAVQSDEILSQSSEQEQDALIAKAVENTQDNVAEYLNQFLEKYQRTDRASLFFCDVPIEKDISDREDKEALDFVIECLRNAVE